MPIIAFGHKRMRGKSTAATFAHDFIFDRLHQGETRFFGPHLGPPVTKLAFADPLKLFIAKGVFGLSEDQVNGTAKHERDLFWRMSPREILQKAGTEAMRKTFGDDIWTRVLERNLVNLDKFFYVIQDVRFISEAAMIKRQPCKSIIIRLDRELPIDPLIDSHQSEIELDRTNAYDYVINNNFSLETLQRNLQDILTREFQLPPIPD